MRLPQDRILHIDTEFKDGKVNVKVEWQGEIVRCKDCIQKHIGGSVTHYYWCDLWDREVDVDNYCSWAERREP